MTRDMTTWNRSLTTVGRILSVVLAVLMLDGCVRSQQPAVPPQSAIEVTRVGANLEAEDCTLRQPDSETWFGNNWGLQLNRDGPVWAELGGETGRGSLILPAGPAPRSIAYALRSAELSLHGFMQSESAALYLDRDWTFAGVLHVRREAPLRWRGSRAGEIQLALRVDDFEPADIATRRVSCAAVRLVSAEPRNAVASDPTLRTAELVGAGPLPVRVALEATVSFHLGLRNAGATILASPPQRGLRRILWDLGYAVLTGWVPAERVADNVPRAKLGAAHKARPPRVLEIWHCAQPIRLFASVGSARHSVGQVHAGAAFALEPDDSVHSDMRRIRARRFDLHLAPGAELHVERSDLERCERLAQPPLL